MCLTHPAISFCAFFFFFFFFLNSFPHLRRGSQGRTQLPRSPAGAGPPLRASSGQGESEALVSPSDIKEGRARNAARRHLGSGVIGGDGRPQVRHPWTQLGGPEEGVIRPPPTPGAPAADGERGRDLPLPLRSFLLRNDSFAEGNHRFLLCLPRLRLTLCGLHSLVSFAHISSDMRLT